MSRIQVTKKHGIQQDTSLVNQLLFRYLPYWPLFVIMLVLGLAAAYAYIRYKVPSYEANASIMVKDQKKGTEDSKIMESFNLFGSKKIVENEIEMIKSRTLLGNVVKDLRLYSPVYEEGKVNIIPAFTKSPVDLEVKYLDSLVEADKVYQQATKELFENEKDAIELIKKKEIIDLLERTSDKCQSTANVILSIFLKNA